MRNKEGDPNSTQDKSQEIVHITKMKIAFKKCEPIFSAKIQILQKLQLLDLKTDFWRENSNNTAT